MYNGIGLTTARGSGTNGYVQRNLAFMQDKPRQAQMQYNYNSIARAAPTQRAPNQEILEHERKRQIEVKVMEWAEQAGILDKGLSEEDLDALLDQKRQELTNQNAAPTHIDRDK